MDLLDFILVDYKRLFSAIFNGHQLFGDIAILHPLPFALFSSQSYVFLHLPIMILCPHQIIFPLWSTLFIFYKNKVYKNVKA